MIRSAFHAALLVLAAPVAVVAAEPPFPWTGDDLQRPVTDMATVAVTGDPGGRAGFAVAVTDWDGDGRDDLVVAEPWADVEDPDGGIRYDAGRIGVFLAPFIWRTGGDPPWIPRTLSMDDADVLILGPAYARLGYRLVARPAGDDGPALAASLPDLTGARDPRLLSDTPSVLHAGEIWLLDGGDGQRGELDAGDVLWNHGKLWWEGDALDNAAWVPNDVGYELAALDDLDGDGIPELAVAVPSVVVFTGELPVEVHAGGTLVVPGQRILDGDLGDVGEGWFLAGSVGQLDPVFTGATYLPRLASHGADGLVVGELAHHRGAGAAYLVPASTLHPTPLPLDAGPDGWPDGPGPSPVVPLDGGLLTVVGEGTAVGGEFTFGSALAPIHGAPYLAAAALQYTGPDTPPRAVTELIPRTGLALGTSSLMETDDLDPWRILGDEHPFAAWEDENALEADLDEVARHIEASSGWWSFLLGLCLALSPEHVDHQCQADYAALYRFASVAMAPYPRSAHVPAPFDTGLVIGEPLFDGGRGAVHAVLPDWRVPPDGDLELAPMSTPAPGWQVTRLDGDADSWFGHTVLAPGDMDGDGIDDLVFGAPGRPRGLGGDDPPRGAAYLLLSRFHADHDGDGLGTSHGDCDDENPDTYPGASERCDGVDNDCDGEVPSNERDDDRDGYMQCAGDCDDAIPLLHPADEDDDGWSPCGGDCDDGDPALTPEDRDGDGFSTCAGDCDDGDPAVEVADRDGDGWTTCGGPSSSEDCDDGDPEVNPGAGEVADGRDNDCDGIVDEGVPSCLGCGWNDAGRTASSAAPSTLGLALAALVSLRLRRPAGRMRRSR